MNLYNCVSLLTATAEATSEHVYPDGSQQILDFTVDGYGTGVFDWFGQLINWMNSARLPLPAAFDMTFMDVLLAGILLFILGWLLGQIIRGGVIREG